MKPDNNIESKNIRGKLRDSEMAGINGGTNNDLNVRIVYASGEAVNGFRKNAKSSTSEVRLHTRRDDLMRGWYHEF